MKNSWARHKQISGVESGKKKIHNLMKKKVEWEKNSTETSEERREKEEEKFILKMQT